ncbi:hypothetical protein GC175_04945 [bacterium]|nr:hypothetical protein [bacterium]
MAKTVTVDLPKMHSDGQNEMLEWAGHGIAFCGRRYGKTEVGVVKLFIHACADPGLYWWVGLSWRSASMKRAWRLLKEYARQLWKAIGENPEKYIRESDKEIRLPGGGEIWLRTAERPDSLAGEGVKGVVMDEFSLMPEAVWSEYVRATLIDYGGWSLFIGVPKGRNWAARLWQSAHGRERWRAWRFTSYDNPHLDHSELDAIKLETPERLWRQEYLAEVMDDSGLVFRNVTDCATAQEQERAQPGHVYIAGVDWGRTNDSTVFAVVDTTLGELCYLDRMTGTDYELQVQRLHALAQRFNLSTIHAETNNMGSPLVERLQREGLPVVGFTTTNASKQAMIDRLVLAFEQQAIKILPDEVLINELMAFEMDQLPSGLIRYSHPSGGHDDCVIALGLAWQGGETVTWLLA